MKSKILVNQTVKISQFVYCPYCPWGGGGVISDSIDLRSDFRYFVDLREIGKPLSRKTKWGLGAKPPAPPGGREATQDALAGSRGEAPGKFWSF